MRTVTRGGSKHDEELYYFNNAGEPTDFPHEANHLI